MQVSKSLLTDLQSISRARIKTHFDNAQQLNLLNNMNSFTHILCLRQPKCLCKESSMYSKYVRDTYENK